MSHPHNPDTWIVPAPKCRLVDGSLPERDIPDQAMPSLKHLYPATSAVISPVGSAHPQKEADRCLFPVLTSEHKNITEGQFLPGLKTGVPLPM